MPLTRFSQSFLGWIVRHPAVFSGLVIYAYYLVTTLDFLFEMLGPEEAQELGLWDYVSQFDALTVMWLLAYTFVRSLALRERVHEEEKKVLEQRRHIEVQAAQIQALKDVTVTFMDKINNPVAIIVMYLGRLKKHLHRRSDAIADFEMIRKAADRISKTLKKVASMHEYKVVERPYGRVLDI